MLRVLIVLLCMIHLPCWESIRQVHGFSYLNGYQQDQSPTAYRLPGRQNVKLQAFKMCQKDCASKCNYQIYSVLRGNKAACHTCLLECISAWTEQAEKIGVKVDGNDRQDRQEGQYRVRRFNREIQTSSGDSPSSDLQAYNMKMQRVMRNHISPA